MDYKKILLDIVYKELPGCKVYLFGSRARKEHDEGADIDLALDMGAPIDQKKIFVIEEEIEGTTIPLSIDLVDIWNTTDELKKEIEAEGVLWEN